MSFSYSGGLITQTGTDADLSLISGLTGVTTTVLGAVTSYSLDNATALTITGTLTIDPRVNFLEMRKDATYALKITSTGSLILGEDTSYTYGTQVTQGLALRIIGRTVRGWVAYTQNKGNMEWYGATIDSGGGIETRDSGVLKVREGKYISQQPLTGTEGHQIFFLVGSFCDIIGLDKTLGTGATNDSASVGINGICTVTNLSGVTSTGRVGADNRSSTLAPVPYMSMNGFTPLNGILLQATTSLSHIIDCTGLYVDSLQLGRRGTYGTVTRHGQAEAYKTCNGKLTLSGVGVAGIKVSWTDVDNLSRGTTAATEWGQEYLTDRTYTDTTDVNGEFTQSVLEAAWYTTNPLTADNWQSYSADKRLETGEKITFNCFSYLNSPSTIQFVGNTATPSDAVSPQSSDPSLTELVKATVDAYATIDTPEAFYDRAKSSRYDNFLGEAGTIVSRSGSLINANGYDIDIDATAVSAFAFVGNKITIKSTVFTGDITTTGAVTLLNGASVIGTVIDSGGTATTLSYSITNLIAGSRVKIRNESTSTNIYNEIVAGTSLNGTYTEGVEYTVGDTVVVQIVNVNGLTAYDGYQSTSLAGSTGFSFLANQVLNTVYDGNNVNGSTVTGIVLDQGNVEFDIDEVDNKKTAQEIYAWYENEQMTATGIEVLFGAIMPDSAYRYAINQGTIDLQFDNKDLVNALTITGGYFYRLNGTAVTASGSGTIEMVPNESYVADSSVIQADLTTILADTAGITAIDTVVDDIKATLDGLHKVDEVTSVESGGTTLLITKGV